MRKFINRIISIILVLVVLTGCLSSCENTNLQSDKINIVTTIFPIYDWTRQIVGENNPKVNTILLERNGVDIHNFQPTADDIITISTCDLLIYVGGESDSWVEDILSDNPNLRTLNLMNYLKNNLTKEEVVEGMDVSSEESDDHGDEHGEEHDEAYDEHVWLSLRLAASVCAQIGLIMNELDPEGKETYVENTDAYIKSLMTLDSQYMQGLMISDFNTILVADRFAFAYLAKDYMLEYYAAFLGCSAETEASFDTIVFLSNKIDELSLKYVLTLENSDGSIASAVIENCNSSDVSILTLNSIQSVSDEDIANGITYISLMESNLQVLKTALGQ